ncbi:hypothetical protein [Phenylobacterium aquaticum]|uniref:hypothetical protein n=1 Tax=Phenylobacterium aquaticum TaxID=1763816 RepID=UPI0026F28F0C|nr:hypothetical protein [Phenylobacterium aquaticum]
MEIHKPKAAHNWSEFLIEIGTIVCGILIALAGEQAVEAFHWRHEVEAERSALHDEARDNLSAVAYRLAEAPCIDRRLAELEEGFRRQAKGVPLEFRQPFARPPIWVASTGTWDIAVSGQALGHMTHKEKLSFSDAFDSYKAFARLRNEEDVVWRRLALINHREVLGPGDWVELHQAWGEAMGTNDRTKSLMTYIMGKAALGQHPQPIADDDAADLKAFCTSLF